MKDFEYYSARKDVRKSSNDIPLADSLFKEMEGRIERAFKMDSKDFPKEIFENIYDSLRCFCDALLALEGYKSYSHEASISFLMKKGFDVAKASELNAFRIKRNGSKYYAESVKDEDVAAIKKFYKDSKNKIYAVWHLCRTEKVNKEKGDGEHNERK